MGILICLIIIAFSMVVIWRASDGFEAASDLLGENLSNGVRGATINAIGSSMPELFTTLFFLLILKDTENFAAGLGTTAGSAIFNSMIIPAVVILAVINSGVVKKVNVSKRVLYRDGISLLVAEVILIYLISGDTLSWWHGLVLMGMYGVYVIVLFRSMKGDDQDAPGVEEEDDEEDELKTGVLGWLTLDLQGAMTGGSELTRGRAWSLLIVSMTIIGSACLLLVKSCEWIGSDSFAIAGLGTFAGLNIPIIFISVILASAATSVPDTILSIRDAKRGNYDDAVSNAIGSNIFDVCFALGLPLFLYTLANGSIHMAPEMVEFSAELRTLLLLLTVVGISIYVIGDGMGRVKAILLLGIYFIFTFYIVGRSQDYEWANNISEQVLWLNSLFTGR